MRDKNLTSASRPFVTYLHTNYEDASNEPGFTKLEEAALMIAAHSGHIVRDDPKAIARFSKKCVKIAKAVLREANK